MLKRGLGLVLLVLVVFSIFGVYAQNDSGPGSPDFDGDSDDGLDDDFDDDGDSSDGFESDEGETGGDGEGNNILEEAEEEFKDVELKGAGITPDSPFYFVEDKILSNFRSDLDNREKKIAEVTEMIREGDEEAVREAMERYRKYSEDVEREIDPEMRRDARRSAVAIKRALEEVERELGEENKELIKEFKKEVLEKEEKIVTAAEIVVQIRSLCEKLNDMGAWEDFEKACKTEEDSSKWQRKMFKDLSDEQRKEAEDFFDIMSQCMRTQGKQCRCEDITIKDFEEVCSEVAPLYAECLETGNEELCKEADEKSKGIEDSLPDYLREVMAEVEERFGEARVEGYMPPECREARAGGKKCIELMFRRNAPGPCLNALDRGDISFTNEREARDACEKIMFEEGAPPECAGLRDFRECGQLMFKKRAPSECIEAGIDGSNPSDPKKCQKLMEKLGGDRGMPCPPGESPGINDQGERSCIRGRPAGFGNCGGIKNSEERLKCYDKMRDYVVENKEVFDRRYEGRGPPREEGFRDERRDDFEDRGFRGEDFRGRGPPECAGLSPEECGRIMRESGGRGSPSGEGQFGSPGDFRQGPPPGEGQFSPPPGGWPEGYQSGSPPEGSFMGPESGSSSPESGGSGGTGSPEGGTSGGSGGGEGGVTGGAVRSWSFTGNAFLDYYWWR